MWERPPRGGAHAVAVVEVHGRAVAPVDVHVAVALTLAAGLARDLGAEGLPGLLADDAVGLDAVALLELHDRAVGDGPEVAGDGDLEGGLEDLDRLAAVALLQNGCCRGR